MSKLLLCPTKTQELTMNPASLAASVSSTLLPPSPRAAVESGEPAALVALSRELRPYLDGVSDPRGRQGRRYELAVLLVFCLVGFCTGCLGYLSVARWGRALKPDVLREFGFSQGRTPCAATWLNLFRVLDWEDVAQQFHAWAEAACLPVLSAPEALPETGAERADPPWQGIAIDGKRLCGSLAAGAETAHVVSIVAHASGVSVREVGVGEKQGELTVAPGLLASVLGAGRVITGDALFTQRPLCRQIREGGSHYVLIVKENQPTLRAEVEAALGAVTPQEAQAQQRRVARTVNQGHGRIENRLLLLAAVTEEQVNWPGVAQVFFLERSRYQPGRGGKTAQPSRELIYGVTSLAPKEAGPATVLRLQRGHWSIENQVHWVLDTFFREDERRLREGTVARGVAALRRGALNLLRLLGGRSIPEAADRVKADPTLLLPFLGMLQEN
jgi:predicted transposase YbfD/YdcC